MTAATHPSQYGPARPSLARRSPVAGARTPRTGAACGRSPALPGASAAVRDAAVRDAAVRDAAARHPQLLLAILGEVFDVSKGAKHYAPGKSYSFFTGRDGSRAFVTGDFTEAGLRDDLDGLSPAEVKEVAVWRDRYRKDYTAVGVLYGRYYDADGTRRPTLAQVDKVLRRAADLEAAAAQELAKYPGCNSRWAQGVGGEVWCDDDPVTGWPRWPRHMYSSTQKQTRCVCVTAALLAATSEVAGAESGRFSLLPNCAAEALRCPTAA